MFKYKSDSYRPVRECNTRRGDGVNHLQLDMVPAQCSLCHADITHDFIDGRTTYNTWAMMCPTCYAEDGIGLGLQRGQRFTKCEDGLWLRQLS